eukprot:7732367-Pyramimonas_sp.AAC.1
MQTDAAATEAAITARAGDAQIRDPTPPPQPHDDCAPILADGNIRAGQARRASPGAALQRPQLRRVASLPRVHHRRLH